MEIKDIKELNSLADEHFKLREAIDLIEASQKNKGIIIGNEFKLPWALLSEGTRQHIINDLRARYDLVKTKLVLVGVTNFNSHNW